MKKQIDFRIVSLVFSVLVICFAIAFYAVGVWTEPTASPPGDNVLPPINTGADAQTKTGALRVGGLTSDFDTYLVTQGGNVGIGTVAPSEKLDVDGNIVASGTICDSGGANCIGGGSGGNLQCTRREATSINGVATVNCQAGEEAIGGGFDITNMPNSDKQTYESSPLGDLSGWKCETHSNNDITCYAVCCTGGGGGGGLNAYIKVSDQVASGVAPQANQSGTWTTKRINTENHDDGGYASIASNQITLEPGTYRCSISSPLHRNSLNHKVRLRNVTDNVTTLVGTSEHQHDDYSRETGRSFLSGQFTINVTTVFEIQHYKQAGTSWGVAVNLGEVEVYTVAEFWKVE